MIHVGDVAEVCRSLPANSFDAVLCDPPYGLAFMGKRWDYDVPSAETWAEVLRVCKPGAPLLAFFGTRTYHRGVVRIEDAGWEIRDCIAWMHGQGFPKNRAAQLKPAFEPVVLARKPLDGTLAQNVERYGVGGLNIEACRLPAPGRSFGNGSSRSGGIMGASEPRGEWKATEGRWPANVILDEEVGALLDEQAGERPGGRPVPAVTRSKPIWGGADRQAFGGYNDSGGASRFFYCAKASTKERGEGNKHPTVKPLALTTYLARLIMPPTPGRILVPFAGSGSEMLGALKAGWPDVVGIEREEEYAAIARRRLAA